MEKFLYLIEEKLWAKIIIILIVVLSVGILLFLGTRTEPKPKNDTENLPAAQETNANIINQPLSDEAAEFIKNSKDKNTKSYLEAEEFDKTLSALKKRNNKSKVGDISDLDTLELTENPALVKKYGENSVIFIKNSTVKNTGRAIMYLHGGLYLYTADKKHITFCDMLSKKLSADVFIPLYPLAPENTFKDSYDFLLDVYKDMLGSYEEIGIMGDSAGGGLGAGFCLYLAENNLKLPKYEVLISPWLDLSLSNPDIEKYEQSDVLLSTYGLKSAGKLWAGGNDLSDYRLSPVNGNVKNLPDTLLFVGSDEMMYPDCRKLYDKMKKENKRVTLVTGEGLFHAYPLYGIPERENSAEIIADFTG